MTLYARLKITHFIILVLQVKENECTLNKLAEAIFQHNDVDLQFQNNSIATVSVCKDYLTDNVSKRPFTLTLKLQGS